MDQLIDHSASAIAKAIREKKVSSKEVVNECFKRINAVNPSLNAVVQLSKKRAREEADEADNALARGHLKGPLHGVPMTIKDSFDTKGVISTGGTLGRKQFIPSRDATVVTRLKKAGAILLGKTNTPEFTLRYLTDNLIYGQTNNPFDQSCSPGGSSGGSAAIVATGGSPFDIGSDYGGSLRYPSHCCGVTTIKPTSGRVPRTGHILPFGGILDSFQQIGPITRRVEDLKLILPLISGPDCIDPGIFPMPLREQGDADIKAMRVVFHVDNGIVTPSAEIKEGIYNAIELLENECAEIAEKRPECIEQSYELITDLFASFGGPGIKRLLKEAGTEKHTLPWLDKAKEVNASELDLLLQRWYQFQSRMLFFFKDYDVMICPVNAYPALKHGTFGEDLRPFSYTSTFNLTGWPAATIRCGTSPQGLPIGLQIVAHPGREDVVLAVAAFLEKAFGGFSPPMVSV